MATNFDVTPLDLWLTDLLAVSDSGESTAWLGDLRNLDIDRIHAESTRVADYPDGSRLTEAVRSLPALLIDELQPLPSGYVTDRLNFHLAAFNVSLRDPHSQLGLMRASLCELSARVSKVVGGVLSVDIALGDFQFIDLLAPHRERDTELHGKLQQIFCLAPAADLCAKSQHVASALALANDYNPRSLHGAPSFKQMLLDEECVAVRVCCETLLVMLPQVRTLYVVLLQRAVVDGGRGILEGV